MSKKIMSKLDSKLGSWVLACLVLGFGGGIVASGCSVSPDEICNVKCSCEGCNQAERDDCVADVNAAVNTAAELGCSDEYADWLSCVENEAECRNGDEFAWDGCEIEEDALTACSGQNVCVQAADKLCNTCGGVCDEPDPSGCSGRVQCQSKCILNATCTEIFTVTGAFASCTNACP